MDEIKAFIRRPSGSGVYVVQTSIGPKVKIVYKNSFMKQLAYEGSSQYILAYTGE